MTYLTFSGKLSHISSTQSSLVVCKHMLAYCSLQVKNMGVTSILVENGVNQQAFRQGLMEFSQNSRASDKTGSSGKSKQK
jgi:hypothetical protein